MSGLDVGRSVQQALRNVGPAPVLFDVERKVHVPLVAHRWIAFGADGSVGWLPNIGYATTLVEQRGGFSLATPNRVDRHTVEVDKAFVVANRTYRLERREELVFNPRSAQGVVLFNAVYLSRNAQVWRGFRTTDPERAIVDVALDLDGARASPSTIGVPVGAIANVTSSQRAGMDEQVAAAILRPFLVDQRLEMDDAVVTWDGDARALGVDRPESLPRESNVVRAFLRLVGRPAKQQIRAEEVADLHRIIPAPAAEVAAVVRALFPNEWAIESAVREQVGLVEVAKLASPS